MAVSDATIEERLAAGIWKAGERPGGRENNLLPKELAAAIAPLVAEMVAEARLEEAKHRLNRWPPLGALQSVDSLRQWIQDRQEEQETRIVELESALAAAKRTGGGE